jgi:methionyl-tRNA formyltransferase
MPSVILMGSKPGSVVALRTLLERGWDVRHVVVSRKIAHPWIPGETLEEAARANGLSVVTQPELTKMAVEPVDFVVSYMFRYRVRPEVIAVGSRASVNFHAGPLPEYGGWAFYNVAILEGAAEYGCTCHHLDDGFDTGPLVEVRRFPIDASNETAFSLERRTQEEMIRLFVDFCELAESGRAIPSVPQDPARMRCLSQEQLEAMKQIPRNADAETVDRYARAFWYPPYPGAYVTRNGVRIEVIPESERARVASLLHADDLDRLSRAARAVAPESRPLLRTA